MRYNLALLISKVANIDFKKAKPESCSLPCYFKSKTHLDWGETIKNYLLSEVSCSYFYLKLIAILDLSLIKWSYVMGFQTAVQHAILTDLLMIIFSEWELFSMDLSQRKPRIWAICKLQWLSRKCSSFLSRSLKQSCLRWCFQWAYLGIMLCLKLLQETHTFCQERKYYFKYYNDTDILYTS